MSNIELVTENQAETKYEYLNDEERHKYAVIGMQAESLENATQIEVTTVITTIVNSRNIGTDGKPRGVSNRDMAKNKDVNTSYIHMALEILGYAEDKQVTFKGFEASNGTGVKNVDYYADIPLFYYTDEGSLYWHDIHKNFKSVWDEVLETEVTRSNGTKIKVKDSTYNEKHKERKPAMPKGFMKMLQDNDVIIMKNDEYYEVR